MPTCASPDWPHASNDNLLVKATWQEETPHSHSSGLTLMRRILSACSVSKEEGDGHGKEPLGISRLDAKAMLLCRYILQGCC